MKNLSHAVTQLEHRTRAQRVKFRLDRSSELRVQVSVFDAARVTMMCCARTGNYDLRRTMNQNLDEARDSISVTGRAA
jgi:hypothetical protein